LGDGEFYERLRGEFAAEPGRDLFVFIHGYNVTFDAAAKRAAQIAYDMGHSAVPVLFSWPSRGRTVGYIADTAVVRLSGRRLAVFLEDLVERSGAETIHIVAHSMGSRALSDALEIMALRRGTEQDDPAVFGQVLFAAPDVDALLFAEMARTFRPLVQRLTLYASEQDWALASSRKLHGAQSRAGQGGDVLLVEESFDSIDMSELGEDMLAHSYFADDSSAIADMATLFWRNAPPGLRCGMEPRPGDGPGLPGWDYRTGECASRDLIGVIAILREGRIETRSEARAVLPSVTADPELLAEITPLVETLLDE
jgi:esterase/lipase superfamily enzyme